ncbi:DNA-binding response regulator, partial [Clostridium perfringens]
RDEIIELVLGDKSDSFDRVIDSHIKNLRGKIEENTRKPKFIVTVYGVGYKFEGKKI